MRYENYSERFNSLSDFIQAIEKREINKNNFPKVCQSIEGDLDFTGTERWEQAHELLYQGDSKSASLLMQERTKIEKAYKIEKQTCRDYVGFLPCVPAYLSGQPRNMINIRKSPQQIKKMILNVPINIGVYWSIESEKMFEAGAKILTAINILELNGYRTNIDICKQIEGSSKQLVNVSVNVKRSGEPLNILKIAYPLVNPSFNRRHLFRFIETLPIKLDNVLRGCYGYTKRDEKSVSLSRIIENNTTVSDIVKKILDLNK